MNMQIEIWDHYSKELKTFEAFLAKSLNKAVDAPQKLTEGILYSIDAGGKRLRPLLFLKTVKYYSGNEKHALKLACALEMIHTASLIHDDLPAIDNDHIRRGKPSNHAVYGEAFAIINGDAMLNLAYEFILSEPTASAAYFQTASFIAAQSGQQGMLGGQYLDIFTSRQKTKPQIDTAKDIHKRKTASLFLASIVGGAILAKQNKNVIQSLTQIAESIGLLFQVYDDLLDILADSKTIGKTAQKDKEQNKAAYPVILGTEKTLFYFKELAEKTKKNINALKHPPVYLLQLIDYLATKLNEML